ncbi:MAG: ATP synthase F1 subunit epsilon [Acidobacteria bacterium]|nr:ATP synthase F1 subunit epsilon [Acidobacteriota bacterium]
MAGLNLILVTHAEKLLEIECSDVGLPGRKGDMGILPGHAALISTLRPGELSYQPADGGGRRFVAVAPGFCEVADDTVTVLTETAEPAEDIDAAAATTERDELAAEYSRASFEDQGPLKDRVDTAQARVDVAARA